MSASISTFVAAASPAAACETSFPEAKHRRFLAWVLFVFFGGIALLAFYGQDYYRLSQPERALSRKHHLLKPGGVVGANLGLLGVVLVCGIFLYSLRRRWRWLQKQGTSKHWLDLHVVLGIAAPVCIAFHSSFKFRGLAGLAFLLMVVVSISGLIGRYLYAQVLQDIAASETLLRTLETALEQQRIVRPDVLRSLFPHLPDPDRVSHWSPLKAALYMLGADLARPLRIARLRLKSLGGSAAISSILRFGGARDSALHEVLRLARRQSLLSRRMLLLSHAKRVLQLWHVVHKPFSYTFAILALLHIGVAMMLGFL
ncbi:MAG TPA: hypothetical protein VMB66_01130 [Candidatus Acidoferrales bacterium]|nr:hypothetical protein [Candidatus Acidoferrales bacterium]